MINNELILVYNTENVFTVDDLITQINIIDSG